MVTATRRRLVPVLDIFGLISESVRYSYDTPRSTDSSASFRIGIFVHARCASYPKQ